MLHIFFETFHTKKQHCITSYLRKRLSTAQKIRQSGVECGSTSFYGSGVLGLSFICFCDIAILLPCCTTANHKQALKGYMLTYRDFGNNIMRLGYDNMANYWSDQTQLILLVELFPFLSPLLYLWFMACSNSLQRVVEASST